MRNIDDTTFENEVDEAGEALSPARAALLFARECAYPDLRPSDYLIALDDLAAEAEQVMPDGDPQDRGLALARFLFDTLAFQGNRQDYGDPRNSYLNQVLDRRLGLPISLSVIFLEVGRRLRLPVAGVGLPGHFIAAIEADAGPAYLDPFDRGRPLSPADCAALVAASTGLTVAFDPDWLRPTPPRAIVARMLNNLRNVYVSVEDWPPAILVLECLAALQPDVAEHARDLGVLHYRAGSFRQASALLNEYLVRSPEADDAEAVRQGRDLLLHELARLN